MSSSKEFNSLPISRQRLIVCQVMLMREDGYSLAEIANKLNVSIEVINGAIDIIKKAKQHEDENGIK